MTGEHDRLREPPADRLAIPFAAIDRRAAAGELRRRRGASGRGHRRRALAPRGGTAPALRGAGPTTRWTGGVFVGPLAHHAVRALRPAATHPTEALHSDRPVT